MKKMKKIFALLIAMVMVLGMSTVAFAQTAGTGTEATITIKNASKGETYKAVKLFDATVTGEEGGSIAYQGTIPSALSDYFEQDTAGNISLKDDVDEDDLFEALASYAETASGIEVESDGSVLTFNVDYGYYIVTTSQGDQAITVTSTNPNAEIVDKNYTTPIIPEDGGKKIEDDNVGIGETITYTITFQASNFIGSGEDAVRVGSYTIEDTLPDFLDDVTVTSIIVNDGEDHDVTAQFIGKKIVIDWYDDEAEASLYKNNATITITYTAVVTDDAAIAGEGNKNEVTITAQDIDDEDIDDVELTTEETVYTYAIVVQKVNDDGEPLKGATFSFPVAVASEKDENGYYVADYSATTQTASLTTPDDGVIVIKGVKAGDYTVTETAAPEGYNALTSPITVTAEKLTGTTTSTTTYLDADGNVTDEVTETAVTYTNNNLAASVQPVVNKTGSVLPSTGGIGTTIFYIIGATLVIGAGVVLVTRRRMNAQ